MALEAKAQTQQKPKTVGELLVAQKKQIEAALPKHLTADRMLRVVMTEIRKNPELKKCDSASLIGAIIQSSQLGLEPGTLGHAYLIPFKNNKKGITECQFIIGYKGMIELIRRSGSVSSLEVRTVHENDHFEYCFGLNQKLEHWYAVGDRGQFKGVYIFIKFKDGSHYFDYMRKEDVDEVRKQSKAKDYGPWVTHYSEMAQKSIIRRSFKYLPCSIELQTAIELDESADRGEQDNSYIIDGEFNEVEISAEEKQQSKADEVAEKI